MSKRKMLMAALITGLFLVPSVVNASVKTDEIISKISPDKKTAVLKMVKPKDDNDADAKINGYFNRLIATEGYDIYATCDAPTYVDCKVTMQSTDYASTWENGKEVVTAGEKTEYDLKVTYDQPTHNVSIINGFLSKFKDSLVDDPRTWYTLSDLSLINYYLTSAKSELWNVGAGGRAAKYIKELNEITDGTNINFYIDLRMGNQDDSLMYESAFGPFTIFYNDYAYGVKEEGIYLKRVIYIPNTTADTKEAYITAAQKRINDYLKNESVEVTYGGLLSSLPEESIDIENSVQSDGNYYNIKIKGRTYKFYIVKADDSLLVNPEYNGKNIDSNISVYSKDSSIPLDSMVLSNKVNNNNIEKKIGTKNYISYDISLYSEAKEAKIEKLDNGLFEVSIPVPTELNDKDLVVYYETSDGKLEEHIVTITDGKAVFTTNHFSVYTLAEKVESTDGSSSSIDNISSSSEVIDNPSTFDNIYTNIIISVVSLIVLASSYKLIKMKNN